MPQRPVQAAVVQHENKQFPREAPGFTADVNSLQDLWDAVHLQPGVPKEARLVIETQNPAGGTWWQRFADLDDVPSTELDPIKVKAVRKRPPGTAEAAPAPAGNKGNAGKKTKSAGRPAGKKQGAAPKGVGKKGASAEPETPVGRKGNGRDTGRAAKDDDADEDVDDLVHYHLSKIEKQVTAKDSKLDRIEAQMLDSYDNDKKVAVLARIQDRLAATLATLHEQRTAILVAALAAEDEDDVDVDYEETWAQRMMYTADDDDDDDDIDDDDIIDDFS